jgi:hypothetical protein
MWEKITILVLKTLGFAVFAMPNVIFVKMGLETLVSCIMPLSVFPLFSNQNTCISYLKEHFALNLFPSRTHA